MLEYPSVFVVILNYNHLDDLKETIQCFLMQNYPNFKLLIVDNNSSDNSPEFIKTNYPIINLIENKENYGWAGGNNIGIKYAIDNGADYILLANNDLYFDNPSIISQLVATIKEEREIGIIGPVQYYYFNRELMYTNGWDFAGRKGRIYNIHRSGNYNKSNKYPVKNTDSVSGAFMMFSRSLINKIGYIDEKYFLYAEDTDFSIRTWHSGYKCAIRTDLIIYHKISATSGESPKKLYYKTRNLPYTIFKNKNDFKPFVIFFTGIIYSNIKMIPKILFYSKYKNRRIDFLMAFFTGWIHFLFNKMGKVY